MESLLLSDTRKSTRSIVAFAGRPLHPMPVIFPIAYLADAAVSAYSR